MHEYDITLKGVLRRLAATVLQYLTGFPITRWHNTELPEVRSGRADLLGETADGTLVHIELQSTNESGMVLRMLEYATAIHRHFGRFPHQIVLYVGESPLRMPSRITGPELQYSCRMLDIRELDSEALIASDRVEDNVIAVLMRLGNKRAAVKRILRGIAACEAQSRAGAFREVMYLAGLRSLGPVIEREAKQMPILNDIMDHPVIGRERKLGRQMGLEEGLERGLERERQVILRLIGKRFGPVPATARKRMELLSAAKLERVALRLLDARNLDELLG